MSIIRGICVPVHTHVWAHLCVCVHIRKNLCVWTHVPVQVFLTDHDKSLLMRGSYKQLETDPFCYLHSAYEFMRHSSSCDTAEGTEHS